MSDSEPSPVLRAREVLRSAMNDHRPAILTTASADGQPHATWMATMTSVDFRRLVTLTSPQSRKVGNIRRNPRVEWLFSDPGLDELVYLHGTATILDDVGAIKEAWRLIPHKEQAFFLETFNPGPGFAIIDTTIEEAVYCVPKRNLKVAIDPAALAAEAGGSGDPPVGPRVAVVETPDPAAL